MGAFKYIALEDSGRRRTGVVDASDAAAAYASVSASGVHVLEINESAAVGGPTGPRRKRVSRADLALFTRRLADLASAGLPLDRALALAGEQSENATLVEITEQAVRDVRGGLPTSEALGKFPKLFPTVFTMTLKAGEASGQFAEVATRLADLQQSDVKRRGQITAALVYPAVLIFAAIGVVAFLMLFVVPRLSEVFTQLGGDLPMTTQWLLGSVDFLTHRGPPILVGIIALGIGYQAWAASPKGAIQRDQFLLHAPVFGKVLSKAVVSRYARVLGTLVFGGVPILEALRIAGSASGNKVFEASSLQVVKDVKEGRRIAEAMRDTDAFPSVLVQMVAVGEETGDLPRMLGRISETLDFEVDNGMQKLTALLEPIIVLGMGALVGFVVISVILPIYQAQQVVKLK